MLHISSISCTNASLFPSYHPHFRTVATYFHHFLYHRFHISNLSVLLHTDATYFRYFLYQRLPFPLISLPFPHRCYIFPSFPVPSLPHFQPFCPSAHRCYIFPQFLAPSLPHFQPFLPFCAPMLHISSISCTITSLFPSYHPHFRTVATYFHHFLYHRCHNPCTSPPAAYHCDKFLQFPVTMPPTYFPSEGWTLSTVHPSEPSANIIVTLSPAFLPRAPFSTTPSASVARTYPL